MTRPTTALPSDLDELACFAVYSAGLAFNRVYRRVLQKLGLTYPQFLVLVVLWAENAATVGRLGERLFLDTNTLTPLLKRLESLGFVARRRDPDDERKVIVSLTEKGSALQAGAEDVMRCVGEATGLSRESVGQLTAQVKMLRGNLERYSAQPER